MKRDGCPGMLQQCDSDYLFARCLVTRNGCNMGPPLASEFGTIWVEYVDCKVYDWQGFVVQGRLQVERCGKALINCQTGQILKIAHFAGVKNPDAAMCTWPVEVTSLLSGIGG